MANVSEPPAALPPLPPSPLPDDLLAGCRAAFLASAVRTVRASLEVHRTHLRICTPAVVEVSAYARRLGVEDLVLSFEQISLIRPVGTMTAIVELPHRAAIALTGPSVRSTLAAAGDAVAVRPRRFRPFFVGFWLINQRSGRVYDSRPLP